MVEAVTVKDREKVLAGNVSAAGRERSAREMAVAERAAAEARAVKADGAEKSLTPPGDEEDAMDVDRIAEPKGLATPDAETAAEKA